MVVKNTIKTSRNRETMGLYNISIKNVHLEEREKNQHSLPLAEPLLSETRYNSLDFEGSRAPLAEHLLGETHRNSIDVEGSRAPLAKPLLSGTHRNKIDSPNQSLADIGIEKVNRS